MRKENRNISIVPDEVIINRIYLIRKEKVMLDKDLAELYGVSTGVLNQAVKRNLKRFPADFMFQLTRKEFESLISQIVISNRGGTRKLPFAFTEQGVAMLSGVLHTDTAIEVNIRIIRIFARIRNVLASNKEILIKLEELEKDVIKSKEDIETVFEHLRALLNPVQPARRLIGFKRNEEEEEMAGNKVERKRIKQAL